MIDPYRKKTNIIVGILLVASLAAGYFFTWGQWKSYSFNKQELSRENERNQGLTTAYDSVQTFLDNYEKAKEDQSKVELALPMKTMDMPNFTASLDALSKQSGLTIQALTIEDGGTTGKIPAENSIQTVKLGMTAQGFYSSMKNFIIHLENHLRLVDIDHISAKSDENGVIQFQLNVRTYYQK